MILTNNIIIAIFFITFFLSAEHVPTYLYVNFQMQTDRGDVLLLMDRQEESAVFVEALQNTLIYRLDCVKNMIQSKGTTNQKIQDELIQINRVATCTDLVGEKVRAFGNTSHLSTNENIALDSKVKVHI